MGSWNVNDGSDQFTLISLLDSDSTVAFWLDFLMKFIHSNVNWFFHRNWFIVDELPHSLRKWKRADRGIEHLPRIPQHRREYHCHANDMQMSFVCARENEMLRCLLTWRKHMQMSCRYASAAAQWAAQLGNDANACVPFPASGPAHRIHLRPHLHNWIEGGEWKLCKSIRLLLSFSFQNGVDGSETIWIIPSCVLFIRVDSWRSCCCCCCCCCCCTLGHRCVTLLCTYANEPSLMHLELRDRGDSLPLIDRSVSIEFHRLVRSHHRGALIFLSGIDGYLS